MQSVPYNKEGYQLLHDGVLALSDMQMNGIRIDVDYCKQVYKELGKKIKQKKRDVENHKEIKEWRKKYKSKFNLDSTDQIVDILFNEFGYKPLKYTDNEENPRPAADREALEALGLSFTDDLIQYRKLSKIKSTYIKNLLSETCDGFLHPMYNLNTARTFRSSSQLPNAQNMPVRDPEAGKYVRRAFIARENSYFIEGDYGGVEIKGSSWYHHDPTMLGYLRNPETADMHADFMSQIFRFKNYDLHTKGDKQLRKGTKNGFTFPQFYGDYYRNNAVSLWNWAELKGRKIKADQGLQLSNEKTAGQHLIDQGIKNYKQFEKHVQQVEKHMWYESFPVYRKWKDTQYQWYINHGYLTSLSGFTFQGVMTKNDAVNYPIQSACFHCLLWSIIRLNYLLKKYKMKAKLISQIHDSIIADVPKDELNPFLDLMKQVMCHEIKDHWDFIITPLELEVDCSELNGNWNQTNTILEYIH